MLDLRRLQALHAVVTTGSVKDAAARLGYTPSAVSQHITTLERETRTVLLEPAGRGVRHDGVAVRRLHHACQPERHILAATRSATSGTGPVRAMITALQTEADAQRHRPVQPRRAAP